MYESERRRTAPLSSPHAQQPVAARAMPARMARTDAVHRPVEPPNPPIVESAQPVLPLGGAPVQARISPGSKPERIARRRAQRAARQDQPAAPDGEAIAAMEYEVNHPIAPPPEPAFGEDENNPPPEAAFGENENNPQLEPEAVGPAPAGLLGPGICGRLGARRHPVLPQPLPFTGRGGTGRVPRRYRPLYRPRSHP